MADDSIPLIIGILVIGILIMNSLGALDLQAMLGNVRPSTQLVKDGEIELVFESNLGKTLGQTEENCVQVSPYASYNVGDSLTCDIGVNYEDCTEKKLWKCDHSSSQELIGSYGARWYGPSTKDCCKCPGNNWLIDGETVYCDTTDRQDNPSCGTPRYPNENWNACYINYEMAEKCVTKTYTSSERNNLCKIWCQEKGYQDYSSNRQCWSSSSAYLNGYIQPHSKIQAKATYEHGNETHLFNYTVPLSSVSWSAGSGSGTICFTPPECVPQTHNAKYSISIFLDSEKKSLSSLGICSEILTMCEPTETIETSCEDGIDNDCDGLFDNDDSDCDDGEDPVCEISDWVFDSCIDKDTGTAKFTRTVSEGCTPKSAYPTLKEEFEQGCLDDGEDPVCEMLWWYDIENLECNQKEFCGAFMYEGLKTFDSSLECEDSLDDNGDDDDDDEKGLNTSMLLILIGSALFLALLLKK